MRIFHLIPRFTVGGAERLVLEYAKYLPQAGFEVVVVSVRGRKLNSKLKTQNSKLIEFGGWFWTVIKQLRSFVLDGQPDIVHTHIFSGDLAGYLLKRSFPQIKWVSTQHNVARQHSWWRRFVLRVILKKVDRVIAVSPRVAEEMRSSFGVSEERLRLIPNAITLDSWLKVTAPGLLRDETLRLAAVGRLEWQKGIDLLLNALSQMKEMSWRLSVFGTGRLETQLKAQASQLGIADRIIWHGVFDNLPERMHDIDVVVASSRWEGMSLSVMEAMAAGRVVIASEAAGEGIIEHMKTGMIIERNEEMKKLGNPPAARPPTRRGESGNEIAKLIRWVNENREEAKRMAANARQHARENFGMERHLDLLQHVYEEINKN